MKISNLSLILSRIKNVPGLGSRLSRMDLNLAETHFGRNGKMLQSWWLSDFLDDFPVELSQLSGF